VPLMEGWPSRAARCDPRLRHLAKTPGHPQGDFATDSNIPPAPRPTLREAALEAQGVCCLGVRFSESFRDRFETARGSGDSRRDAE
jgi:hypothetical protein